MTLVVLKFVCETLFHSKRSAESLVLKLSRYTADRDSKWSAMTIGGVHTVMAHVELSSFAQVCRLRVKPPLKMGNWRQYMLCETGIRRWPKASRSAQSVHLLHNRSAREAYVRIADQSGAKGSSGSASNRAGAEAEAEAEAGRGGKH
jgi:hypothetical protein